MDTISNARINEDDLVICADGGYDAARAAGLHADIVIGDMDSCSSLPHEGKAVTGAKKNTGANPNTTGEAAKSDSCTKEADQCPEIIRLDAEKDETDTFAAAKLAVDKGAEEIIILGGLSGRFDHSVAVLQTMSFLDDIGLKASAMDGSNLAIMISGGDVMTLDHELMFSEAGEGLNRWFSVYSFTEKCEMVTIKDAKYPLEGALLTQSFPLGTSNEFLPGKRAEISLQKGKLLVIISEEDQAGSKIDKDQLL